MTDEIYATAQVYNLVKQGIPDVFLPNMIDELISAEVEIRGCESGG